MILGSFSLVQNLRRNITGSLIAAIIAVACFWGGWAAIIRDDLGCTYQACGYGADTSANYVP